MICLDNQGPLYSQIYRAMRAQILEGRIRPGSRVPATRILAAELGLSRNIVIIAYDQLTAEGYLVARTGAGTFVAPEIPQHFTTAKSASGKARVARPVPVRWSSYTRRMNRETALVEFTWTPQRTSLPYDFRYGRPSMLDFPQEQWCRIMARRARRASIRDLDYGPPEGLSSLREILADYLNRTRALRCVSEQIIITNGSQQALDLAARVLVDPGRLVLLEEPHYRAARAVMTAAGARIRTVSVDGNGLCTEHLSIQGKGCRLIVVTPSHQFPTGAVMTLSRRIDLLSWSYSENAFIFEDDYDSEYRYSGRPVEALQSLDDRGSVLYAGTFSKVMFPSLRLGYLVVPERLSKPVRTAKALLDTGSPSLPQLALVDFIREGFFERHLHRLRIRNAARRSVLLEAIHRHFGEQVLTSGIDAGLHVLLWFPAIAQRDVSDIRKRAERLGVGVYSVAPFYVKPPPHAGLLLGYASLSEKEITEGVKRLASAMTSYALHRS